MNPTADDVRAVFLGACYVLGAVVALSIAVSVFEATVRGVVLRWKDPGRVFPPCGLQDYHGHPCMLPADHLEREHATLWMEHADRFDMEERHRFDDTATEGRFERRYKRGHLSNVTRTGDTVPT